MSEIVIGNTGNYVFIVSFTVAFLVNVVVCGAVLAMKTNSKLSKYFLTKYLAANTMVVLSQMAHAAIHLIGRFFVRFLLAVHLLGRFPCRFSLYFGHFRAMSEKEMELSNKSVISGQKLNNNDNHQHIYPFINNISNRLRFEVTR